jgi:hypothetical protein
MTDPGPEDQLKEALQAARRHERAQRDESVAEEIEQTNRLIGSIEPKNDYADDVDAGDDEQPS